MLGVFPGPFGIEGACLRCGAFMRKWSVMSAGNWASSDKLKVAERQGQAAMKSLADKKTLSFLQRDMACVSLRDMERVVIRTFGKGLSLRLLAMLAGGLGLGLWWQTGGPINRDGLRRAGTGIVLGH